VSRRPALTVEDLRAIRETTAVPKGRRKRSLRVLADLRGLSYHTVVRAARNEQRCYREMAAPDTHRVSRGTDRPWQSHTERKVCRPEALSVASSTGTPEITGVAGSAETRYHESRADLHGVSGNAGAVGRGPISP
jgi:hypothetical protein